MTDRIRYCANNSLQQQQQQRKNCAFQLIFRDISVQFNEQPSFGAVFVSLSMYFNIHMQSPGITFFLSIFM